MVDLVSNALSYVLYLFITSLGVAPKLAMTLLYMAGVLQTFAFNKSWTFRYVGYNGVAFWRHVILYALGYLANLLLMGLFVDILHWPHQWVMAGLVVLMVILFFLGQKFGVFRPPSDARLGG